MKKNKSYILSLIILCFTSLVFASCGGNDEKVKEEETPKVTLSISPLSFMFEADGGTKTFDIAVDETIAWELSNDVSWITVTTVSGSGNENVAIQVAANEVTASRTAIITVVAGEKSTNVTINQEAAAEEEYIVEGIPADASQMSSMTSLQVVSDMGIGWNVGNSLEAIGGETAWGNPLITKDLIDAVKAAGFNTVRIPVAWSKFSDTENYTIKTEWMARVREVVDYVIDNDMYAMLNIHWDGGWMQPTYSKQDEVNKRLTLMWEQIAVNFRDYDYHLLFAGTNEVMVTGDYGTPTVEYYTVQNSFNKTFLNTVRATGGRNAYRYLVIQGFNTNIDHAVSFAVLPEDTVENRMMMEVHYYDPYNFALNESNDNTWQWGANATDVGATETWANESYVDSQFQKIKTKFIDHNIGVILGEYGAIARTNVQGHKAYREAYMNYITKSALAHDIAPIYWDNGYTGDHAFGLFNRAAATVAYPDLIQAIMNTGLSN